MNDKFNISTIGSSTKINCGRCGQGESFAQNVSVRVKQFKRAHRHEENAVVKSRVCVNRLLNSLDGQFV